MNGDREVDIAKFHEQLNQIEGIVQRLIDAGKRIEDEYNLRMHHPLAYLGRAHDALVSSVDRYQRDVIGLSPQQRARAQGKSSTDQEYERDFT